MGKYSKGDPANNNFEVTFTFPTKELRDDFCGYMSDGGGEWGFFEGSDERMTFDYTRCFPAWGWKKGQPKYVDVYVVKEDKK
jgi:hypothetical protein